MKRNPQERERNILKKKGKNTGPKVGIQSLLKKLVTHALVKRNVLKRKYNRKLAKYFSEFCKLGDKNLQNAYLFDCITPINVKRRPKTGERGQYRSSSYRYTVSVKDSTIEICATAFRSIHGIGITRFTLLRRPNQVTAPIDKRGQHGNQPKIAVFLVTQIKDHIKSFPRRRVTLLSQRQSQQSVLARKPQY